MLEIPRRDLGFTLTELMIATAAFAIIMLMFSPMFSISQKTFTTLEISTTLKDAGQNALNHIAVDLNQCKRLFKFSADVNSDDYLYYQNLLNQIGGVNALLSGSKLPINNSYSSISPSDPNFDKTLVGNTL